MRNCRLGSQQSSSRFHDASFHALDSAALNLARDLRHGLHLLPQNLYLVSPRECGRLLLEDAA